MNKDSSSEDKKYELDHEYDGIKEYDYPAPRWWQIVFIASVIWGVGYIFYYSVFDGETLRHKLDTQLEAIDREKAKSAATGPSENDLTALVSNPAAIKAGKDTFVSKCASCHGDHGQGLIGPNLTDNFWLHGGTAVEIFKTVDKGVPDKGMPPWGPILAPGELKNVVAFIRTLHGTNPSNPKAPQGVEVKQ